MLIEEENRLCELGLLGDLNAQTLLDTMIWMCGLYFALYIHAVGGASEPLS